MKKILFSIGLFSFFFFPQTQAAEDTMCLQVIQAAVDANGTCQQFPTPCDVPEGWKTLPTSSCTDVDTDKRGSRIDEVQNRRQRALKRSLQRISEQRAPEIAERKYRKRSDRPRFGTAQYTRNFDSIDNKNNRERASLSSRDRRTFSQRNYNSPFAGKRNLSPRTRSSHRYSSTSANMEQKNRNTRRPNIISRTSSTNTADPLSNDPALEVRQEQRFRSNGYGRHWRNRGRVKVEKKEKADPRRRIGLRRTFRGTTELRRNANLGGRID